MNLSSRILTVQGIPSHILEGGSGSRVLLLHGWNSYAASYKQFFSSILDAEMSVVIPDLPGFGQTSPPKPDWGITAYADWVKSLLDELGWDTCVVVGHSFGGQIATQFTHDNPNRVKGLVLYAAAVVRPDVNGSVPVISLPPIFQKIVHPIMRMVSRTDYAKTSEELKPVMRRIIREDLTHLLPKINVQTVLLWGGRDDATPVDHGKQIHKLLPNAEMRIIENAGHSIRNDRPEQFRKELLRSITMLYES